MNELNVVTGATGLVGSHLMLRLAEAGKKIRAVSRESSNREHVRDIFRYYSRSADELFDTIEWVNCNLYDHDDVIKATAGASILYNCAAIVSFQGSEKEVIIENNVRVAENIVNACLENSISKLCHVSSTAAIGCSRNISLVKEDCAWDETEHHSAYAESKHLSERVIWKGIEAGLKAVIVNPSIIIGPGDWNRSSSQFFSSISKGMLFYTRGITGYVSIDDVVKSMIILSESRIAGERFLVTAENLTYQEVFTLIAGAIGARRPLFFAPPFISYLAMAVSSLISKFSGKKPALTRETLSSAYSIIRFDNSKIREAIGIEFKPVSMAIRETGTIFRSEGRNRGS
ncbi:MAG: NAD-dependent epimerase/dehydratase family protein [Bacteroidales bacterium]